MYKDTDGVTHFTSMDEVPEDLPVVHTADILDSLTGVTGPELAEALDETAVVLSVEDEWDELALVLLQAYGVVSFPEFPTA